MAKRYWPEQLNQGGGVLTVVPNWQESGLDRRREALLDAAEQLLAEKGLLQAGLQEIGAAIGLAPYAVRAQFGSKQMVVEAVLDRHLSRLIDRLATYRLHDDTTEPAARLANAIRDLLNLLFAYRHGQRVFVAAISGAPPHLQRVLTPKQRHLAHFFAGLIATAVPEAEGRTELAMPAAMTLMGMASWHVLWFRERGALAREEYARLLAHMLIDGVRAAAVAGVGAWEER